jgi:hypothetical protein
MENIQSALELFRDRLNGFLTESLKLTEVAVVLSNLRDADGGQPPMVENRIVLSLTNIEQNINQSVPVRSVPSGGQDARSPPFASTNLYLLVLANFTGERYPNGLGLISKVIGFLQDNPIFNRSNLPGLDATIESLSFEFVNLDAAQWSLYLEMAGVTYLPAAMYRVRIAPRR